MENTIENRNTLSLNQPILVTSTQCNRGGYFELVYATIADIFQKGSNFYQIAMEENKRWGAEPTRLLDDVVSKPEHIYQVLNRYRDDCAWHKQKSMREIQTGLKTKKLFLYVYIVDVAGAKAISIEVMEFKHELNSEIEGHKYVFQRWGGKLIRYINVADWTTQKLYFGSWQNAAYRIQELAGELLQNPNLPFLYEETIEEAAMRLFPDGYQDSKEWQRQKYIKEQKDLLHPVKPPAGIAPENKETLDTLIDGIGRLKPNGDVLDYIGNKLGFTNKR